MNYQTIKELARSSGRRVNELLALSLQNDPFYVGQPAELERAGWFANLWDSGILAGRDHVRGIHYVLISRDEPILMPDGRRYENTDRCWSYLNQAIKSARYLDLVDPRAFKDRRSQPAKIFTTEETVPFIEIDAEYYFDLNPPDFPELPALRLNDYTATQKYMIEIWIEKSTMEDVLLPLCQRYGCNLVTGVGELSLTQCVLLVDRIIKYQRPCRVLYISDFDPAGLSMPAAVSRKVEFYQRKHHPDIDIQVQQVALTYEQCQKYKLPRTPLKERERRANKFQALYGEGATELDALEALYPGELAKIVQQEIERFYDDSLEERCEESEDDIQNELDEQSEAIAGEYQEEIDELRGQYEKIRGKFTVEVSHLKDQIATVWHGIREKMEEDLLPEVLATEAEIDPDNEWDEPLYSSDRDYEDQIRHYQKFKNGDAEGG